MFSLHLVFYMKIGIMKSTTIIYLLYLKGMTDKYEDRKMKTVNLWQKQW